LKRENSKPDVAVTEEELVRKRNLLVAAIQNDESDLLNGIRVYVSRFRLVSDIDSVSILARDILHETVVTALQSLARYDPMRPARPWLLSIAINHIRHRHRSQEYARQHVIRVADTPQAQKAAQESHEEALSEEEMFTLLHIASESSEPTFDELLSLVEGNDRQILDLYYRQGLDGKSLAASLGISEGTAWTRLCRAKARLRKAYLQSESEVEES